MRTRHEYTTRTNTITEAHTQARADTHTRTYAQIMSTVTVESVEAGARGVDRAAPLHYCT